MQKLTKWLIVFPDIIFEVETKLVKNVQSTTYLISSGDVLYTFKRVYRQYSSLIR